MNMKGRLFTFEGIECSGKGEQSSRLLAYFEKLKQPVSLLREPGGTIYGEVLRAILKHPELAVKGITDIFHGHGDFPNSIDVSMGFSRSPYCELFMFLASRAEFIDKKVKPALEAGEIVITDRLHYSTRAYQGGGRFFSDPKMITTINALNEIALQEILPDLIFFLDISIEEMIRRRHKEAGKDAFFEKTCDRGFFERVRKEYLNIALDEPDRFIIIDGIKSIEEIHMQIISRVKSLQGET